MSAAVAAVPDKPGTDTQVAKSPEAAEREVVIADLTGTDGKTIQSTTSFTVTWRNPETGKVLVGTFTARRPSLGQLGQIAVLKAKLNGGQNVDNQTDWLHDMMAGLQVCLVDFPDWWKPADFFTADPLREVWDHVRSWADSFRNKRVG